MQTKISRQIHAIVERIKSAHMSQKNSKIPKNEIKHELSQKVNATTKNTIIMPC
jgi:hypothetical protein